MKRYVKLSILAAIILAGCGGAIPDPVNLCAGAPCKAEGVCVDMIPGRAICRAGAWVNEWDGDAGCAPTYPQLCTASSPAVLQAGDAPYCQFYVLVCAAGVSP